MSNLYKNFDIINYDGIESKNFLRQVKVLNYDVKEKGVYHPYIIKEGERADSIAFDYYGSSDFTWLVYESNNIINPYKEWPLSDREFNEYLLEKYGYVDQLKSEILYYENPDYIYHKTTETIDLDSVEDKVGWKPVFTFDWEVNINNRKKFIRLLSVSYLEIIKDNLKEISREINGF